MDKDSSDNKRTGFGSKERHIPGQKDLCKGMGWGRGCVQGQVARCELIGNTACWVRLGSTGAGMGLRFKSGIWGFTYKLGGIHFSFLKESLTPSLKKSTNKSIKGSMERDHWSLISLSLFCSHPQLEGELMRGLTRPTALLVLCNMQPHLAILGNAAHKLGQCFYPQLL